MSRLLCLVNIDGRIVKDFTDVTPEEESKITSLIQNKRLPARFTLNNKRIDSDTILGFHDKLNVEPAPPIQVNLISSEASEALLAPSIGDRVRQSDWYQRGLAARNSRGSKRSGSATPDGRFA